MPKLKPGDAEEAAAVAEEEAAAVAEEDAAVLAGCELKLKAAMPPELLALLPNANPANLHETFKKRSREAVSQDLTKC